MQTITNQQWQKKANGIFVYQVPQSSAFIVRTIADRSNVNMNEFSTRDEAEAEVLRLQDSGFRLPAYFVEAEK